ncbi:MAG: Uma2 family endonuclease [Herpetosiphonaceae bacterium]|nr:Uma2 family endonuclease [Herpetosiphonaceae bacterium]
MSDLTTERVQWTTADLELLPDNGTRYEIIDGDLYMSRQPHWHHQQICGNLYAELRAWSQLSELGQASVTPGIIFSDADNVVPDVAWASNERLAALLDQAGHLMGAPELVVEVVSPGPQNEARDRQAKLKLYSLQGVQEYWLVDGRLQQLTVYRRERGSLKLAQTLLQDDELASPLLPGFSCALTKIWS